MRLRFEPSCRLCCNWYRGDEKKFEEKNHIHVILMNKEGEPAENEILEIKGLPRPGERFRYFWGDVSNVLNNVLGKNKDVQKHWIAIGDIISKQNNKEMREEIKKEEKKEATKRKSKIKK